MGGGRGGKRKGGGQEWGRKMKRGKEQMDRGEDGEASNITQYIETPTTAVQDPEIRSS